MKTSLRYLSYVLLPGCLSDQAEGLFILQSPDFADSAMMNKKYAGNAKENPGCTGK